MVTGTGEGAGPGTPYQITCFVSSKGWEKKKILRSEFNLGEAKVIDLGYGLDVGPQVGLLGGSVS